MRNSMGLLLLGALGLMLIGCGGGDEAAADPVVNTPVATNDGTRPAEPTRLSEGMDVPPPPDANVSGGEGEVVIEIDTTPTPGQLRAAKKEHDKKAPEGSLDVVNTLNGDERFTMLTSLLAHAGLIETLNKDNSQTVFAPTDEAFAKLTRRQMQALRGDRDYLVKVLGGHIMSTRVASADTKEISVLTGISGVNQTLAWKDDVLHVGRGEVIQADMPSTNAVIHVVDTVLLP